jgi:hypothetical protein
MISQWKLWCDAANEKNAGNILTQVRKILPAAALEPSIEPYHKGGYVVSFSIKHTSESWNDYVVEVIAFGQCLGHAWNISGDITLQVDGWSNESRVPGIQSIQWSCDDQYQS